MKKKLLLVLFLLNSIAVFSQKINGQWRGFFDSFGDIVLSNSTNTEYVLELEINDNTVSGYSYSYFQGRKYYVICKLKGLYYKNSNSIKVTETERVKGNTPPDFSDCLQIHYLTYEKEGNTEKLAGKWETAPGQRSTCGDGKTVLTRRTLSKDLASFNKRTPLKKVAVDKKNTKPAVAPRAKPVTTDIAKAQVKPTKPKTSIVNNPVKQKTNPETAKKETTPKEITKPASAEPKKAEITEIKSDFNFEKRKAEVLKTIEIENETFKVDLYDNGEVDGDSISLFYNNKLILSHKKLSEKAITLTLPAASENAVNELTMYADNLGEIAPNTALMVITDGEKRYEIRISSDLKNSGTIRFVHK